MPEALRGGFAGGEVWAAEELGKKGQKSELFGCCEWELAQKAREEADGLRAGPTGPTQTTRPGKPDQPTGRCAALCLR